MTPQDRARKLDEEGKCIVCQKTEDGRQRGLCGTDYQRFRRARDSVPEKKRQAFITKLIENGQLLPSRQGRRPDLENVFAEAAQEFTETPEPKDIDQEPAPEQKAADFAEMAERRAKPARKVESVRSPALAREKSQQAKKPKRKAKKVARKKPQNR